MNKKLFSLRDIILAVIVICVCAAVYFVSGSAGKGLTVTVTVSGETVHTAKLDNVKEPYFFKTETVPETVIRISSDGVCFESSECENQLCVKSGTLTRAGSTAVCLPAGTSITLTSEKDGVDAVTW